LETEGRDLERDKKEREKKVRVGGSSVLFLK